MVDFSGIAVIVIFIALIVAALAIALKLLSTGQELLEPQRQVNATPVPMDEAKFLAAFLKPVYDDGLEEMETAVDAARDGLDFYGRGAVVEAGEQFIAAGRSLDVAGRKFREVLGLVEDPGEEYARLSKARLAEVKRLAELAKDMDAACDAMLEGRKADADFIVDRVSHLRKLADAWRKE